MPKKSYSAKQRKLAAIAPPRDKITGADFKKLKAKSISLHWEFMFTRSMFSTDDMIVQHQLLTETAELIDQGIIKSTLNQTMGSINAHNLREAHRLLESGKAIGKIVLEGFDSWFSAKQLNGYATSAYPYKY